MMVFKVLRNGRRFNSKLFSSYEEARSFVRKWLRKKDPLVCVLYNNSNARISDYGFKIQQT